MSALHQCAANHLPPVLAAGTSVRKSQMRVRKCRLNDCPAGRIRSLKHFAALTHGEEPMRTYGPRLHLVIMTAVLLSLFRPAWAQQENEAVGFATNHPFESGHFGEDIDI